MKLHLFQELIALNQAFEQVLRGLERMEKLPLFQGEELCYARAEVESARVQANREFFDNFDALVEKDAAWAYKFRRAYDQKVKDPFDLYLEVQEREEARKKKGLPPRVVLLPEWDKDDEERYDEEQARKRKRAANQRRKTTKNRKPKPTKPPNRAQTGLAPAPEGEASQ
jgi:Mn-containing catalase